MAILIAAAFMPLTASAATAPSATASAKASASASSKASATASATASAKATTSATSKPGKAANLKVTNVTQTSVTLTWDKAARATGYAVYKKVGDRYKLADRVTGTSCVVMRLAKSTAYTFRVKPYIKTGSKYTYGTATVLRHKTAAEAGIIKTWNIGGDGSTYYTAATASDSVQASLYDGGKMVISGTGNTAVFHLEIKSGAKAQNYCNIPTYLLYTKFNSYVKTVEVEKTVTPTNMDLWFSFMKMKTTPQIPDGVTSLLSTFAGSQITTPPTIPQSVTNMQGTFADCEKLTSAPVIPSSVTNMNTTFMSCSSLKEAPVIPDGVKELAYTFAFCQELVKAPVIPPSVISLNFTFYFDGNLKTGADIPASVISMLNTYRECVSLKGTINVYADPLIYESCFDGASSADGAKLTVNYGSGCTAIDKIIATKSKTSHIVKGKLVS